MQIRSTVVDTNPTNPTQTHTQLAVQCTHCLNNLGISVYVDVPLAADPGYRGHPGRTTTKPLYCPRCRHPRQFRGYDYADILCTDYFGLTRRAALEVIQLFNELSLQGRLPTTKGHGRPADPIELLTTSWGFKRLLARSAITPLTVSCSSCAGTYTLLRTKPDLHQTPPLYCIWCGSKHTTHTSQDSTEESAWLVLAEHYSLTVQAVQFFYNDWSRLPTQSYPSFAEYLNSPLVAPLVQAAKASIK